ncbi:MAG: glycosyltransferase [Planctomycetota bacterium]
MTQETPLITINILVWNNKNDLSVIISKIKQANYPMNKIEIIVVDNASTDGSPEMVEKDFPNVKLIKRQANNGIGGWNDGFAIAQGEYIIVLDHDAYPEPDAYHKIVEFFCHHPKTGILNLGHFSWDDANKLLMSRWDNSINLGFIGGTSVIRKRVLEKVGFYDERLFINVFEQDFGIRVIMNGFDIDNTYQIKAFHKAAGAYRKQASFFYYDIRNRLWISWKYFPLYAICISNFAWIITWFLRSIKNNSVKEFGKGIYDAFKDMGYLRMNWPRHKIANWRITKLFLKRFVNYKLIIRGVKSLVE